MQTTADFQNRHGKPGRDQSEYLADFLHDHPGLKDATRFAFMPQITDPSEPAFRVTVILKAGGEIVLNLKLKMELGSWKVNDLSVLEEEKEKDGVKNKSGPMKDGGK
jgi:hypothetical protein